MNCPACLSKNSVKWKLAAYAYVCRLCGHEVTRREYEIEIRGRYDDWLSNPPEQHCEHKQADGCCGHPKNRTPECHEEACPP